MSVGPGVSRIFSALKYKSPAPDPFADMGEMLSPGIHLHWALPRALTRGVQVQATATAQISGGALSSITLVNGGYGYVLPPVVLISGGGGSGASVSAVVAQGVVTSFRINAEGSGYASPPQVLIAPSGVEASALPSQSLYHALVSGVKWQTGEITSPTDGMLDNMQVAVGNTSIDALAAIVAERAAPNQHGAREAELLEAFQYNFLHTLFADGSEAAGGSAGAGAVTGVVRGIVRFTVDPLTRRVAAQILR